MPAGSLARRLRRLSVPLLVAALVACGDDGKVGAKDGPVSAPGATPAAPDPSSAPAVGPSTGLPSPSPAPPAGSSGAAAVATSPRVGDWVTWELKVAGVAGKTTLTWRAKAVDGERVLLRVESAATDAAGKPTTSSESEQWVARPQGPPADAPAAPGAPREVRVGAATIATRAVVPGDATVGYADAVPLGGVAWSRGPGGVEQTVVGFGRGS